MTTSIDHQVAGIDTTQLRELKRDALARTLRRVLGDDAERPKVTATLDSAT